MTFTVTPEMECYYEEEFYLTSYYTPLESECSGPIDTVVPELLKDLPGKKFKSSFLSKVKMQGSGISVDNIVIAYAGKFEKRDSLVTATGTRPEAGRTIATDARYVPKKREQKAKVWIDGYGYRQSEDSGGGIEGLQIDIYTGIGDDNLIMIKEYARVKYIGNNLYPDIDKKK